MPRIIPESAREHADLALAVYVEELAARRRVLFVGDAASAVPERLSSVARSVEVVSPRTRTRGTRRGGRILPRPWPSAQDARSWDLVLVPDLLWAGLPAPERIGEMAEWLTPRGVLVVGAEEREDGIDYGALYDLLSRRFEWVRMLGQAPFAGWSVVDYAPQSRELEVTFDGSLLGGSGEEAARHIALCAAREVVLDPYSIVQVPSSASRERAVVERPREAERAPREDLQLQARLAQLEAQLRDRQEDVGRAGERASELEREVEALRARGEHAERRLDQAQREISRGAQKLDEARARADALTQELEAAKGEIAALAKVETVDEDYARVEASLAERARELTDLRGEVERRGVLVRDLVEELVEARAQRGATGPTPPGGGGGRDDAELRAALEAARRRAVDAEAAVVEAGYRLDQVRAELEQCRRARETEREQASRDIAFAQGTMRGLSSRLAETEELRRLAEARLALSQDDVASARLRTRELERDLENAREQVELAIVRAQGAPPSSPIAIEPGALDRLRELEAEASQREGRLYGALLKAREHAVEAQGEQRRLARELAKAEDEARAARNDATTQRAELEARLGQLADEATRALADTEARGRELATARAAADAHSRELAVLRGERDGIVWRLADAEAAVRDAQARLAATPAPVAAPIESPELHDLRQRVEVLGASVGVWTQRAQEAASRADAEATRAADLAVRLSTRDALVGRVQSELASASARRDGLERRIRELDGAVAELRDQLASARAVAEVRADEERRELEARDARIADSERARERLAREHEETRRALAEARQILSSIASGLDTGAVAAAAPASDARLREQLRDLQREAEDRELMLRSLTAQLQDRDDRLRALERMKSGEAPGDERELVQRVLMAEERAVRFERELEQERQARRHAEQNGGSAERDADLRRLHQTLGDRDAQLMVLEGRITQSEREQRSMRDAFAQARASLETLLGEIANDQRAEAADRIASMLRLLRRY
ncbi:hypothetical protein [Sandaracinus amylolyticus]|uniref:Large Ala/Glu-rich protein n=1 Tax=Sandaracinus amylolyticus TaxID=927083 RepID=A0A0F6W356_9BACT|nr:hypothetical protein [Sandaracinus amylolyticus]AKF06230.1 large Ala/Glu-rich protein [Sandaracinus amylolyticus]